MLPPAQAYSSSLSRAWLGAAPAASEDPERLARLQRLHFESLARHAARLPWLVPLAAAFIVFIVWHTVPAPLSLGWMAAVCLIVTLRWEYSRRAMLRADLEVDAALQAMTAFSLANGIVQGAGVALFFAALTLEQKAIVTMIMVSMSAGAVSANAGHARSFYAWALPTLGAIAVAWALQGDLAGYWIAFLLVLTPLLQGFFLHENERVLRESFEIRYRNEKLIRELEVQRQAVARERDRAEEANRAKSRFLASASHDLRQPLHTLSLYSAALKVRNTDARTQEMAQEIGAAIRSLGSLLDALLDISKLDADAVRPEPSRFALGALAARLAADFRPLAGAKGLSLELEAADALDVETDPVHLERMVSNLLDNAIKYTARGTVRLRVHRSGAKALLTVSDTGPGIPRSEHERVFEEFYQLANPERDRSRGIGLGLAIVKRLADLLRIELRLESEVGRGTTFQLVLPLAEGRVRAAEVAEVADAELPPGLKVLVVDDEGSVRAGMRALLESWGCDVVLAAGLRDALDALEVRRPDLIIADHRLRGSETGMELVHRARESAGEVPALLITGDTAADVLDAADRAGVRLLRKPVHEEALKSAIAEAVQA
jgi:signal transduction histidine kinase